jgi:hypothetical protein
VPDEMHTSIVFLASSPYIGTSVFGLNSNWELPGIVKTLADRATSTSGAQQD